MSFKAKIMGVLAVAFLGLAAAPLYAEGEPPMARIVTMEGDVQIQAAAGGEWAAASKGAILNQGAQISSKEDSSCLLGIGEAGASAVKLDQKSNLGLESLEPVKLKLGSGRVFALVRGLKEGSTFQVATSTAVASVRGTPIMVGYIEGGVIIGVGDEEGASADVTTSNGMNYTIHGGEELIIHDDLSVETKPLGDEFADELADFQDEVDSQTTAGGAEGFETEGTRPTTQISNSP
ncbi:MAG: FecR domain-containing protein [Candidatus Omnitrophica bacterium]|nr:FecR domain-containing protein [Candidatus Omnitrophota bacterium]